MKMHANRPVSVRVSFALLFLVAACSFGPTAPTAPTGIVRVWINRTATPIEVYEAIIPACSEVRLTQDQIDTALELRRLDVFPDPPPGSVDLTASTYTADPAMPLPFFIVILPDGQAKFAHGNIAGLELPPCAGRAALPSLPGYEVVD